MAQTIEKNGRTYTAGKLNQYELSKKMRAAETKAKKLGKRKRKVERPGKGDRPGCTMSVPLCELRPEDRAFIISRVREYLPENKQSMLPDNCGDWLQKLTTLFGYDIAAELMSPQPSKARLILLCDPMEAKRG